MVASSELLTWMRRRPFEPFRVRLTDGRSFEIVNPELSVVGKTWFSIGVPEVGVSDPFADHFVVVDLPEICDVEPLGAPAKAGS